jgi:WD40 repeat protein
VWEADTGQEISRMTHSSYVYFVSFSPDGKHVASGGRDNTALVWNTQTGEEIARLPHGDFIGFIAFSPDGAYVLTTESSGTSSQSIAHVWGATTGQEIFRMVHNGGKFSVEFSPDGEHIVSTSEKGDAIIVQHYLPGDLIDDACMHVTRNLTIAEWRKYIGSALPYQAICPNAPLIPVPTAVTATVPTPYSTTTP